MRPSLIALAAALALTAPAAAFAQAPAPAAAPNPAAALAHIRGKVVSLDGTTLTVAKREGGQAVVHLTPTFTVILAKAITPDGIKAGSFIGTTEKPNADGTGSSLEVHVFPPGVKQGEGHYDWDLTPGSMMTNGTVDTVVTGVSGRQLTVSYAGGSRKITVPPNVPIVAFAGGDKAMLTPGASVFILARTMPDIGLVTNSVVTGENGAAPPM